MAARRKRKRPVRRRPVYNGRPPRGVMLLVVDTFGLPPTARLEGIGDGPSPSVDLSGASAHSLFNAIRGCCVAARLSCDSAGGGRDLAVALMRAQLLAAELASRAADRPVTVIQREPAF